MVRQLSKPNTQKILRDLKAAGYTVTKKSQGFYKVTDGDEEVLSAMVGHNGYLLRFKDDLFSEEE